MKTQHNVALVGMINGVPAKTHQSGQVREFVGKDTNGVEYFHICKRVDGVFFLITPKSNNELVWNNAGYFEPKVALPWKIHVTLKKTVGKLIYWA